MRWKAHPPNERGAPREIVDAEIVAKGLGEKLIPIECHGSGIRQLFFAQRSRKRIKRRSGDGAGTKGRSSGVSLHRVSVGDWRRCHGFTVRQLIRERSTGRR